MTNSISLSSPFNLLLLPGLNEDFNSIKMCCYFLSEAQLTHTFVKLSNTITLVHVNAFLPLLSTTLCILLNTPCKCYTSKPRCPEIP